MDMKTPFEIEHKGETVQVIPRRIGMDHVYIIDFPSRRPPIMLTKATRQGGGHFWTTVPEEREKSRQGAVLAEATIIGLQITTHYSQQAMIQ
jgi:hypothetical protein